MKIQFSRILIATAATAFLGLTAACGGDSGSGVDSDTKIADLTASEAVTVCEYLKTLSPSESVDCGNGNIYEPDTDSCADAGEDLPPPSCPVTVGQIEQCAEDTGADVCSDSIPASCAVLFDENCG